MTPLTVIEIALLHEVRRGVLATLAADGRPRLVPIAYVVDAADPAQPVLYSPLDEKPKSVADPRDLARVRDIAERPRVAVLVDRWSEDWSQLGWLRLAGIARMIDAEGPADADEHAHAVALLRAKYTQYAGHALDRRPIIRVGVDAASSWFAA